MDLVHLLREVGTLLVAAMCGALIGFERERHDRPAGLRTHILVCLGSALITLVSRDIAGARFDPGRIAAQIVSGIGFLGAGTILRQGNVIRGLTTAASLWVVAGIGMAMAAGPDTMVLGAVATLVVFFTLTVVNRLEDTYIPRRGYRGLTIRMEGNRDLVAQLLLGLVEHRVEVRQFQIEPVEPAGQMLVHLALRTPAGFTPSRLDHWLALQPGVIEARWEELDRLPKGFTAEDAEDR